MLRLSVDLEHIGYHDESLSIAESGLLDPWVRAGSRMALQRRVLRLGNHQGAGKFLILQSLSRGKSMR